MSADDVVALAVVGLAIGSVLFYTLRTGVPPMPSAPACRAAMLDALPEGFAGTVYELGSGWGHLAFAAARRFPSARIVGYELSPLPWLFSRLRQAVARRPNLALHRGDFFGAPIGDADAVLCYLCPRPMRNLRRKLERELVPGALVICNTFAVPDWPGQRIDVGRDLESVLVYRVPERMPNSADRARTTA